MDYGSRAGARIVEIHARTPRGSDYGAASHRSHSAYGYSTPSRQYEYNRPNDRSASWLVKSTLEDWNECIHPNGSRYWRCDVSGLAIISDVEPPLYTQKASVFDALQRAVHGILSSSDVEEWEVFVASDFCTYIHHGSRSASSEKQTYLQFRAQVESATPISPHKFRSEAMYWAFVEAHPRDRILPRAVVLDATEAITWCYAERVLYEASNAPFEKDNAREMIDLIQNVSNLATPQEGEYDIRATLQTWYCAAVLGAVAYHRRHSHYGQKRAAESRRRAQSDDLDIELPFRSSVEWALWHVVSIVSFGSPFGYMKRIVNVDRTNINEGINVIRWRSFIKEICKEWADSNLLATVLVSATVALLAIPGINGIAQIAGLLSALFALGSVLSGMLLLSNHQARIESSSDAAASLVYFTQAKSRGMGTSRPLAVILSLPISMMLWGMFWFIFAIASCAYNTGLPNISAEYALSTRIVSLVFLFAFVVIAAGVVVFFHRIWYPTVGSTPIRGIQARNSTTQSRSSAVDTPRNGSAEASKTRFYHTAEDTIPPPPPQAPSPLFSSSDAPSPVSQPTHPPPQSSTLPQTRPARSRRPTVGFDPDDTVIPTPPRLNRISELSSDVDSVGGFNGEPSGRGSTISDHRNRAFATQNTAAAYSTGLGYPASHLGEVLAPSNYHNTIGRPLLHTFIPAGSPNGAYLDIDMRQVFPNMITTPPFFVLRRRSQITLIAATNQQVLMLTPENQEMWAMSIRDDASYQNLVSDIRRICTYYGPILSLNVPRQLSQDTGQAFIQFERSEHASAALRGFMDHSLTSFVVSPRLLSNEDEIVWRATEHPQPAEPPQHSEPLQPAATTLHMETSIHENSSPRGPYSEEISPQTEAVTAGIQAHLSSEAPRRSTTSVNVTQSSPVAANILDEEAPPPQSRSSPTQLPAVTSGASHHTVDILP